MVYYQQLLWLNGVVPPGHDGFGADEEHREPRHGGFLAITSGGVLIPQLDAIFYVGLQTSQNELVEVL